jgi:hypothetical protein
MAKTLARVDPRKIPGRREIRDRAKVGSNSIYASFHLGTYGDRSALVAPHERRSRLGQDLQAELASRPQLPFCGAQGIAACSLC